MSSDKQQKSIIEHKNYMDSCNEHIQVIICSDVASVFVPCMGSHILKGAKCTHGLYGEDYMSKDFPFISMWNIWLIHDISDLYFFF